MRIFLAVLFSMCLAFFAQARDLYFSQDDGVIDLGLLRPAVVNGTVVPDALADLRAVTPRIYIFDRSEHFATENYCTGLLIAPDVVLTAAHCVDAAPKDLDIEVYFGDETVNIVGFIAHPDYQELRIREVNGKVKVKGGYNDIALIFLAQSMSHVPALLPTPGYRLLPDQKVFLAGYGRLGLDTVNSEGELYYAEVPVKEASSGRLSVKGKRTSCQGDSGGPLLLRRNNRWLSVGVTSFGDCVGDATPMRTSYYTDWILDQIQSYRLNLRI